MALIVGLPDAAESSPSRASLNGLDGTNFFNAAMLAGFGPYVAVYLAEQKWTQENIGFVLTASGLAGLLALMPGGQLLDTAPTLPCCRLWEPLSYTKEKAAPRSSLLH